MQPQPPIGAEDGRPLKVASLLAILLMTLHLTDDILFQAAPAGLANCTAILIFVVWLYGTFVLAGRRSGQIIVFVGSLLGLVVPAVHMMGAGGVIGGQIGRSNRAFLFVWTLIALGVTSLFSAILSARGLAASFKRSK
ncbi:MAG: hypothetical protein HY821_21270 [Acidobacteria bacterium]|nr:hypothetical protein [Acidobacteriota bacterium]